jgi:hypothetical protein
VARSPFAVSFFFFSLLVSGPLPLQYSRSRGKKAREPSIARLTIMLLATVGWSAGVTNGASPGARKRYNGFFMRSVDGRAERGGSQVNAHKKQI